MNSYKFLVSQLNTAEVDIRLIDTTWINKPKSPTYLAVITYLNAIWNLISYTGEEFTMQIAPLQKKTL